MIVQHCLDFTWGRGLRTPSPKPPPCAKGASPSGHLLVFSLECCRFKKSSPLSPDGLSSQSFLVGAFLNLLMKGKKTFPVSIEPVTLSASSRLPTLYRLKWDDVFFTDKNILQEVRLCVRLRQPSKRCQRFRVTAEFYLNLFQICSTTPHHLTFKCMFIHLWKKQRSHFSYKAFYCFKIAHNLLKNF